MRIAGLRLATLQSRNDVEKGTNLSDLRRVRALLRMLAGVLHAFGRASRTLRRCWDLLSQRTQHFIVNVVVGFAISAIVLGPLAQSAPLVRARDSLLNIHLTHFVGTSLGPDVAYLDADDQSYFTWGYPAVTPRDKVCRLIDFAVRSHARAIVVDVDLDTRMPDLARSGHAVSCGSGQTSGERTYLDGDAVLATYLRDYAHKCRAATTTCTPIILTRGLETIGLTDRKRPVHDARPSFLDQAVGDGPPILWGTVQFGTTDGVVRRWRLWEPVCGRRPRALPSAVLLAARAYEPVVTAQSQRRHFEELFQVLDDNFTPICQSGVQRAAALTPVSRISVAIVNSRRPTVLQVDNLERTLVFRFDNADATTVGVRVPASLITDPQNGKRFRGEELNEKIVVIGASATDGADMHLTPVGPMPGALVVLNEIEDLLHDDAVKRPPFIAEVGLEAASVLVAAGVFLRCSLAAGYLLTSGLIICFTSVVFVLGKGLWLDPVAPLVGILAHELGVHRVAPAWPRFHNACARARAWVRRNFDGDLEDSA